MRVHPRTVFILSVMALSATQTGFAQQGDFGVPPGPSSAGEPLYPPTQYAPVNPAGYPGGGNLVPPPPAASQGAWDPIAAGQNGGPGYHPARQPWPHISPFENRYAEHTNEGGLWFFRSDNSNRRYFANADYRYATYRRPDQTRVGFDGAPEPDFIPGGDAFEFLPVDTGVFFDSFLGNQGLVNTIAVNEQSGEADPPVNGFNVEWGFRNPGGNGIETSIWYTPEAHWAYSRGFNPRQRDVISGELHNFGKPLVVTHSLPLNDGDEGVNVSYDKFFGLNFESVSGGGDLDWLFTPFWRSEWYQFAPTVGFNFLYIGEEFSFRGAESGFGGTFERQTANGFAVGNSGVLAQDTPMFLPYDSELLSEVTSYLVGPKIGLRFEVGGKNLRIVGKSNVGLAANHERLELSGFGIGEDLLIMGNTAPGNQPFRFREEQTHTRLSPTTSHEIIAQAKIFSLIPVINRIHLLEDATFRIGYQINAAFEIQRPNRTIQYNGLPLLPAIRNDRETRWYVESWNYGVHWDY